VFLRVERLASNDGIVALTVEDDGEGDPTRIDFSAGHGLLGMRERVSAFGGSLSIGRAAHGVRVAARIPLILANSNAMAASVFGRAA
jgi:signal transduction histidine kinase